MYKLPFGPRATPSRFRGTALAVSALVGTLALQGCASGDAAGGDSSGPVTLTVLNQSRGSQAALEALAAKYSQEKGIKVTVDTPGPADYLAKLQAKAQSKSMPDLFSSIGSTKMAPFYKAGWAKNLEPELKGEWGSQFIPGILNVTTFKDGNALNIPAGIYSAHWDMSVYGLFVNPANVKAGANKAATTQELIDGFAAGGTNGKGKFSIAASMTPYLVQTYASNYMTDHQIDDTFSGKSSWKTDEWNKTFKLISDLAKAGAIASNNLPGGSDDTTNVEKSFFNTRDVGAIFDGSYAVAVAKKSAPDFTDFESMTLPKAADATQEPRPAFDTGKGMSVNARGKHTKEAVDFLKWLTSPAQEQYFADNAGALPTNPEVQKSGKLAKQLSGFISSLSNVQEVPNPPTPDVADVISRGAQSLVLGETTVPKLLEDIEAAQAKSKP